MASLDIFLTVFAPKNTSVFYYSNIRYGAFSNFGSVSVQCGFIWMDSPLYENIIVFCYQASGWHKGINEKETVQLPGKTWQRISE